MLERATMVEAMQQQLQQWPHMAGPEHEADRQILLVMAEGIDSARESVAGGSAALPLVNACRYVFDTLRKLAPKARDDEDDGFDAAMAWED